MGGRRTEGKIEWETNLLAVLGDDLAGALVGAGEAAAEHDGGGTASEGLDNVARGANATIGDDGNVEGLAATDGVDDG